MIMILYVNFIFYIVIDHRRIHNCENVGQTDVSKNNGKIAVKNRLLAG